MAKYKKNKKKNLSAANAAESPIKTTLRLFNWRRLVLIILSTALAFGIYEALIAVNFLPIGGIPIIMPVYFIIVTLLLVAVIIFNSGISTKKITPDMIRTSEDEDEVHLSEICERLNARKEIAKKLMLVLLPFLFAILFDVLYLFYGDLLINAVKTLGEV